MYILYRFDSVRWTWNYMNSFNTYADATDERARLERVCKGKYKIEFEEV